MMNEIRRKKESVKEILIEKKLKKGNRKERKKNENLRD